MDGNGQTTSLVMHGNDRSGPQVLDHLPAELRLQRKDPANGYKKDIHRVQLADGPFLEGMPKVPQMTELDAPKFEHEDDVAPTLLALHRIVITGYPSYFDILDLVTSLTVHYLGLLGGHGLGRGMIEMGMGNKDDIPGDHGGFNANGPSVMGVCDNGRTLVVADLET